MDQTLLVDFAKLIKKCAFEMNADDERRIDDGEKLFYGATSGPSGRGKQICREVAKGAGLEPLGFPAYLLLAYAWNDVLDWADENGAKG